MPDRREFRKLLAASFVSQTGSHFLTLALAAFILVSTGSPLQSALVFVLSYLPSILVSARLGHWVDRSLSKGLIIRNELVSILATVICGLCIELRLPMALFWSALALRSMLIFIGRAAATKWLKLITPASLQGGRIKLFYLGFFLSTAVSGLLASFVLKQTSIRVVVLIDSLSYLLGIALYLMLDSVDNCAEADADQAAISLRRTLAMVFTAPGLRTSFLLVCASQALFQGAYSAFVSYLPISVFQLGIGGIGRFQLAASLGIIGGFLVNWWAPDLLKERAAGLPIRAFAVCLAATALLVGCVLAPTPSTSLTAFLGLNLAYECVWLQHSSEFFRACPGQHAARLQFTLSACAAFLMSLATLAYSAAVLYLGRGPGLLAVLAAVVATAGLAALARRPMPAYEGGQLS